jgi:esterase/lipase superfamily enzyme
MKMRFKYIAECLVFVGVLGLSKFQSSAQSPNPQILEGHVVQSESSFDDNMVYRTKTVVAADAIISLCQQVSGIIDDPRDYEPVATTVSDSNGRFALVIGELGPSKIYVIRARAPGSDWSTLRLGKGNQKSEWLKPVSIKLEEAPYPLRSHPGPRVRGGGGEPPPKFGTMTVLFATDREVNRSTPQVQITNKNNQDGALTFGKCVVAVERDDEPKDSDLIGYIAGRNREGFYSVQQITLFAANDLWIEFSKSLGKNNDHDALLFMHGYNSSFDDACRRAAQIGYDLKFKGPILLYSWPSHDSFLSYSGDEEMAEWSGPHFTKFLKQVLEQNDVHWLHIIAHSMGNRILASALIPQNITQAEQNHLGQVVFAAPDINRLIFDQGQFNSVKTQRMTLYASNHDQALAASKLFHGYGRAGDTNPEIDVKKGIDSIDASAVDTSLIGHSYFGNSRSVLADLAALLSSNPEPDQRFGLRKREADVKQWWVLIP